MNKMICLICHLDLRFKDTRMSEPADQGWKQITLNRNHDRDRFLSNMCPAQMRDQFDQDSLAPLLHAPASFLLQKTANHLFAPAAAAIQKTCPLQKSSTHLTQATPKQTSTHPILKITNVDTVTATPATATASPQTPPPKQTPKHPALLHTL